ncbi:MAG: hypothetical protein KDK39_06125 [Leptospiraceae bacterium]|nr:hypothetical protein [Leptospiraceae bacterium]
MDSNKLIIVLLGLALSCACHAQSECRPTDPTCNPLVSAISYQSCVSPAAWHRFEGTVTSSPQFLTAMTPTFDQGMVVVGRAPEAFSVGGLAPTRPHAGPADTEDWSLIKYSRFGNPAWVTFLGGTDSDPGDRPIYVNTTLNGDLLISSRMQDTFGTPVTAFTGAAGVADAAYVRLDSNGNLIWNTFLGSVGVSDTGGDIREFADGRVLTAATLNALPTFSGSVTGSAYGSSDAAYVILGSDGTQKQLGMFGGTGAETAIGVVFTDGNAFALGGHLSAAVDASFTNTRRAYSAGNDSFLAWFDSSGQYLAHGYYGGSGSDDLARVLPASNGDVYLVGASDQSWGSPLAAHPGPGVWAYFMARVAVDGSIVWLTFFDAGLTSQPNFFGASVANNGDLLLTAAAEAQTGNPLRAFAGSADMLLARFDQSSGSLILHTYAGGSSTVELATGGAESCDGGYFLTGAGTGNFGSPLNSYPSGSSLGFLSVKITAKGQF